MIDGWKDTLDKLALRLPALLVVAVKAIVRLGPSGRGDMDQPWSFAGAGRPMSSLLYSLSVRIEGNRSCFLALKNKK